MEKIIRQLETEHLLLRKAKDSDLMNIWQNVWRDAGLAEAMLWKPTLSYEEAKLRLERTLQFQAEHYAYFVCLKETDEAIGFAGIREIEPGVFEECGICVAAAYQNRGFGKEILGALLDLAFRRLNGRRFLYGCFHENTRSAAVCKALGFTYAYSKKDVRGWDGYEYLSDFYTLDNPKPNP